MELELKAFNKLLKGKSKFQCVGHITSDNPDVNVDAAITAKKDWLELSTAIERAIEGSLDYKSVKIVSVESRDYGYTMFVTIDFYDRDLNDGTLDTDDFYIRHTTIF